MTEQKGQHSEQYREARRQFDDMRLEDKAVFLLESTVSTLARGLEEVSKVVADSLEKTFEAAERERERREDAEDSGRSSTPGPDNGSTTSDAP